jgi:hypothetical protein
MHEPHCWDDGQQSPTGDQHRKEAAVAAPLTTAPRGRHRSDPPRKKAILKEIDHNTTTTGHLANSMRPQIHEGRGGAFEAGAWHIRVAEMSTSPSPRSRGPTETQLPAPRSSAARTGDRTDDRREALIQATAGRNAKMRGISARKGLAGRRRYYSDGHRARFRPASERPRRSERQPCSATLLPATRIMWRRALPKGHRGKDPGQNDRTSCRNPPATDDRRGQPEDGNLQGRGCHQSRNRS